MKKQHFLMGTRGICPNTSLTNAVFFGMYPFVQKVMTGAFIVIAVLARTKSMRARQEP